MTWGDRPRPKLERVASSRRTRLAGLLGLAAVFLLPAWVFSAGVDDEILKQLKATLEDSGVEPTHDGLKKYLEDLHPNADTKDRLRKLFVELGDDDFFRREAAMSELLRLPVHSRDLFEEAIETGDPEIRWRAKEVLKQGNKRTEQLLHAAFEVIRQDKLHGLLSLVIEAIPFCGEAYLREDAIRTLKAIAKASDAPLFQTALKKHDWPTQQVALMTLEHLLGAEADASLLEFLNHENETLKYTAARSLANHGHRRSLPALVNLLTADDLQIRANSADTLRLLTGERFSFVAYDTPDRRAVARGKWLDWVANHGDTAALTFPIPDGPILRGHTLMCDYTLRKVVELDANHKEIWSTDLTGAWGCQGLPNGHRLVTSYSQRMIVEYDFAGKEVWTKNNLPGLPYGVERLRNGNTLVTCSNNQVLEYAPDGSVAWQTTLPGTPRDAERLENGNTLVALYSTQEVVEVDQAGKIVWRLGNVQRPMSVQRLPNGNTFVYQSTNRKLAEFDGKGTEVWSHTLPVTIYDAQRLPNGNILTVGSAGLSEIDPKGNSVWNLQRTGLRGAHRY